MAGIVERCIQRHAAIRLPNGWLHTRFVRPPRQLLHGHYRYVRRYRNSLPLRDASALSSRQDNHRIRHWWCPSHYTNLCFGDYTCAHAWHCSFVQYRHAGQSTINPSAFFEANQILRILDSSLPFRVHLLESRSWILRLSESSLLPLGCFRA
jgi:hypothetical protein